MEFLYLCSLASGNSTFDQLVDIYFTFCKALDDDKQARSIFCGISKAFD